MARIQLGTFVTAIAGSVSGTTFRRTQRGQIVYNKQGKQLKSAFSKNSVKAKLGNVMALWQTLNVVEKNEWNDLATLYPQKDKFGNTVYYTGREFFTKQNAHLIPINTAVDLSTFDDINYAGYVNGITSSLSDSHIDIDLSDNIDGFLMYVQVYPLRLGSNSKPSGKYFNTFIAEGATGKSFNVFEQVRKQFHFVSEGQKFGFNIYFLNYSGFKSAVQSFSVILE